MIEFITTSKNDSHTKFEDSDFPIFRVIKKGDGEYWYFDFGFGIEKPFGLYDWGNLQDSLDGMEDTWTERGIKHREIEDLQDLMESHPSSGGQIWNG